MKLAIVDIETTGFVREKNNSIVEIAIVLCDTETRKTEILFNNIVRESTLSDYHRRSWIFDHSDLNDASFEEVDASYADFSHSRASKTEFTGSNLDHTSFLNAASSSY
jgi:uncharacterized protein YjbI with pentapeptide repeats